MRILLVEDDIKLGQSLLRGLREENYSVDLAVDGEQADNLIGVNEYDLVVLDIRLPKKDGLQLCREWRQAGRRVPVLMLTANDTIADKVLGLDTGADDYLTKPFEFDELLARMRSLLRRSQKRSSPQLQVADLILDPQTHQVTRAGKVIELRALEFRLLEYLMATTGSVVTRDMIFEHVWDMNFDTESNVLEVYINYLRRKIDRDFKPPLIHTVRGVGYTLKDKTGA